MSHCCLFWSLKLLYCSRSHANKHHSKQSKRQLHGLIDYFGMKSVLFIWLFQNIHALQEHQLSIKPSRIIVSFASDLYFLRFYSGNLLSGLGICHFYYEKPSISLFAQSSNFLSTYRAVFIEKSQTTKTYQEFIYSLSLLLIFLQRKRWFLRLGETQSLFFDLQDDERNSSLFIWV